MNRVSSFEFRVSSGILLAVCGGCIGGSLATSTGPRTSGDWSTAGHQAAHVGENVELSFILTKTFAKQPINPIGIAEYCVLELDGRPVEMELNEAGRFSASYVMPAEWINREIDVRATAYRQYGQRDRIVHQDRVLQSDRADMSDRVLARDSLTMLVYQSDVRIEIEKGTDELDFNAAQLVLRKADGTTSTVLKSNPRGPEFNVEGPSELGTFTVRYEPTSGQVNLTGLTEAELTVPDRAGRPHRQRVEFMTP